MIFACLSASAMSGNFAEDTRIYERSVGSTNLLLDYWWVGALAVFLIAIFLIWLRNNNLLNRLDQRCRAAFADVDALLVERHGLIPNLVEITKKHVSENRDTLDSLLDAQQDALETMGELRMKAETRMGDAINSVVNIAARIPELNHSEAFNTLRSEITRIEEKITAARRFYNMSVEEYNSFIRSFPANISTSIAGIAPHPFFSAGERRENISESVAISLN